jgi:uncharacterized protein YegL
MTVHPVYLVIDTSGSTVIDRWIDSCNSVLPHLMEALEGRAEKSYRLSVLGYGTEASVLLGLSEVRTVDLLPALWSRGFSSLASAISLLNATIRADMNQLKEDGVEHSPPIAAVVLHGLPTDSAESLLEACRALRDAMPSLRMVAVAPAGTDPVSLAGIGIIYHRLVAAGEAAAQLGPAVVDTVLSAVTK